MEQARVLRFQRALESFRQAQAERRALRLRYRTLNLWNVERAIDSGRERALNLTRHEPCDQLARLAWEGLAAAWVES